MNLATESDPHGLSIANAPHRVFARVQGGVGTVELAEMTTSNGTQLSLEVTDLPPEIEETVPSGPNAALYPAQVRELREHLGEWLERGGWA